MLIRNIKLTTINEIKEDNKFISNPKFINDREGPRVKNFVFTLGDLHKSESS
jgi:hypothetical protein